MALDATIAGVNSNSYVTQAAATAYLGDRLNSAEWSAATSANKDAALIMATSRLDAEEYVGSIAFLDQRLKWPRYGWADEDGRLLSATVIPIGIQEATFELALALLKDTSLLDDTGLQGFINVKVGSLDVTPRLGMTAALPAFVMKLIKTWRVAGVGTPVVRA